MRMLVMLMCVGLAGCAGGRPIDDDPAMDAVILGRMMSRPAAPQPYFETPAMIIGTPRGGVVCQRTGPNSVFCS